MYYNMKCKKENKNGVHLKLLMGEVSRLVCTSEYPVSRTFLPNGCIRMLKVLFRAFKVFFHIFFFLVCQLYPLFCILVVPGSPPESGKAFRKCGEMKTSGPGLQC